MTAPADDDPRRKGAIKVVFENERIGTLTVAGIRWGAIEWSDKRAAWCIEDVEGGCLRHASSIHGQAAAKEDAIALAEQMVRDGTMPAPEEARRRHQERRKREREKRAKLPSEIRRKQKRAERDRLMSESWKAEWEDRQATPFFELFAEAFDLADPDLWKSNSFAMLRPRLLIEVRAVVAELEYQLHLWPDKNIAPRLERACKILALLEGEGAP